VGRPVVIAAVLVLDLVLIIDAAVQVFCRGWRRDGGRRARLNHNTFLLCIYLRLLL
jgi:hypothetical protein